MLSEWVNYAMPTDIHSYDKLLVILLMCRNWVFENLIAHTLSSDNRLRFVHPQHNYENEAKNTNKQEKHKTYLTRSPFTPMKPLVIETITIKSSAYPYHITSHMNWTERAWKMSFPLTWWSPQRISPFTRYKEKWNEKNGKFQLKRNP